MNMGRMKLLFFVFGIFEVLALAKMNYECFEGFKTNSGFIHPRNDINVEVGSSIITFYCTLNPEYDYYARDGYRSLDLAFNFEKNRDFPLISRIVNETTIAFDFDPSFAMTDILLCKINRPELPRKGICSRNINVGYLPQKPENFTCISKNWVSLNCSWNVVNNPVKTNYELTFFTSSRDQLKTCITMFKVGSKISCILAAPEDFYTGPALEYMRDIDDSGVIFFREENKRVVTLKARNSLGSLSTELLIDIFYLECPKLESKTVPGIKYRPKNYCYWDIRTHPQYRTIIEVFHFIVNSTNKINPSGNYSYFPIDNYAVVKPDPVKDVRMSPSAPGVLRLEFSIPLELQTFSPGLYHWVQYKSEYEEVWKVLDTGREPLTNATLKYFISDLEPFTNYSVKIRTLSGRRDLEFEDSYWSDEKIAFGKTLPTVPLMAPKMSSGSFEVVSGFDTRDVYVYWQRIPRRNENGPGFGYRITEVFEENRVIPISPKWMTSAYAYFPKMSLNNYSFFVTSENSVGQAHNASWIFIASYDKLKQIKPKSFTKIAYNDNKFEVSWLKPERFDLVENYTVFWCESERDRPYQCEGFLEWTFVGRNVRSLNITVNPKVIYQFAVAANTQNYSSGMVWATCTIIANKVNGKLKNVFVDLVEKTRLKVRWRLDCSDRVGIVTGYKISYCVTDSSRPDAKCKNNAFKTAMVEPDKSEFLVKDLDPYRYYKVGVSVVTRGGEGEVSDYAVNRTAPARPGSPPRNFNIEVQPEREVILTWDPPSKPNGPISFYQIVGSYKEFDGREIRTLFRSESPSSAVLNSEFFVSDTEYNLAVRACTYLSKFDVPSCGLGWNNRTFRTPPGRSGQVADPIVYFENSTVLKVSWDIENFHKGGPLSRYEVRLTKSPDLIAPIFPASEKNGELSISLLDLENSKDWIVTDCGFSSSKAEPYNVTVRAVTYAPNSGEEFFGSWSRPTSTLGYCFQYTPMGLYIAITVVCVFICIFGILYGVRFYILSKDKRLQFDEVERKLNPGFISENIVDSLNCDDSKKSFKKLNPSFNRANSMTTLLRKDDKASIESSDSFSSNRCSSRSGDSDKSSEKISPREELRELEMHNNRAKVASPGYVLSSDALMLKTQLEGLKKDSDKKVGSSGYVSFEDATAKIELPPSSTNNYVSFADAKLFNNSNNEELISVNGCEDFSSKINSYSKVAMILHHENIDPAYVERDVDVYREMTSSNPYENGDVVSPPTKSLKNKLNNDSQTPVPLIS